MRVGMGTEGKVSVLDDERNAMKERLAEQNTGYEEVGSIESPRTKGEKYQRECSWGNPYILSAGTLPY